MPNEPQQKKSRSTTSAIPYVIGAIFLATLGLQIFTYFQPNTSPETMLPHTEDMIELSKWTDVSKYTISPISLPEKLFDSSVYLIGIYPSATKTLPAHTISVVLTKNNQRYAQIDIMPGTKEEKIAEQYTLFPQETVAIDLVSKTNTLSNPIPGRKGRLVHLRNGFYCTNPKPNTIPSMCLITNALVFEQNGNLVQISSDGDHMSQGEMIEMARSMK